ncbi:MAG: hypothetical protein RLZ33_2093, partial [Bacteroidota bacterium]
MKKLSTILAAAVVVIGFSNTYAQSTASADA